MPQLTNVITNEDLTRRGDGAGGLDLSAYVALLDTVGEHNGVGAQVSLEEGENQRTVKRRLSVAAKQRGMKLTWRKAAPGGLRFVLAKEGERPPDARKQREKQAAPEPVPTPAPAARGRGRKAG